MAYESKTEEPIVVTPAKELDVKDFNKKEVEEIAKSVCEPRFDVDNPFYGVETVVTKTSDEFFAAIDDGKLPLSGLSELTDEQMEKILTVMKKAVNGKVVSRNDNTFLFLTYYNFSRYVFCCCFGCASNHNEIGLHIEYYLDFFEKRYTSYISEV